MRLFSDVCSGVDDPYLSRAISLAERARGATAPNPLVGCVIVSHGDVVGEGFHERAGAPHAEVSALLQAGERARGAEVYVTLEPCVHFGRTPPCADALVKAGVAGVTIGMADPSHEAGGGAERLREAGVAVSFARDAAPFEELNAGWLRYVRTGKPLVTAKVGASLDGRIALVSGRRASITGASGASVTRRLREAADAVLVSAATLTADDPALTVRDADGVLAQRQPLRVVLVREQMPSVNATVFTDGAAETLVLSTRKGGASCDLPESVTHHQCGADGLEDALLALGERGICDVLVEPGPRLLAGLVNDGLVDRLVLVSAGGFAGQGAPSLYSGVVQHESDVLTCDFVPAEAGIVGDVSVTVWRRMQDAARR